MILMHKFNILLTATSVVVPQLLICPCVYCLQHYVHLNKAAHYVSCFVLFCNLK